MHSSSAVEAPQQCCPVHFSSVVMHSGSAVDRTSAMSPIALQQCRRPHFSSAVDLTSVVPATALQQCRRSHFIVPTCTPVVPCIVQVRASTCHSLHLMPCSHGICCRYHPVLIKCCIDCHTLSCMPWHPWPSFAIGRVCYGIHCHPLPLQ